MNCQSTTTKQNTHDRTVEELASQTLVTAGQKGPISTFNGEEFRNGKPAESGSRNPKIQALLDKIINDGQDMDVTLLSSFAVKQNSSPAWQAIPKQPVEGIAEVFPSELPTAPSFEVEESPERTKGDIIGFSQGDEDDEQTLMNPSIL